MARINPQTQVRRAGCLRRSDFTLRRSPLSDGLSLHSPLVTGQGAARRKPSRAVSGADVGSSGMLGAKQEPTCSFDPR